jgi:uncharacterized protein (DUF58 family)
VADKTIFSRRFVSITREGWYFFFIVAFIVSGAILRQVNLLVILAGLMIAAILFNWRIAMTMVRWLSGRRSLPDWAHAGDTFIVEWSVRNHRSWVPTWNLNIHDRIAHIVGSADLNRRVETIQAVIPKIDADSTGYGSYRCLLDRRGIYEFGPAQLSNQFPFGLIKATITDSGKQTLHVAPRIGRLTTTWQRRIRATAAGTASLQRKRGILHEEFYGIRPWRSGDNLRWIHWRSTAKRGQLAVKQFDQPTDRDVAIALDLYCAPSRHMEDYPLVESAVSAMATLIMELRQVVKGNIAIGIFGHLQHVFCDSMSHRYLCELMHALSVIQPTEHTEIEKNLMAVKGQVAGSTPLIVISTRPEPNSFDNSVTSPTYSVDDLLVSSAEWIQIGSDAAHELFRLPDFSNTQPASATDAQQSRS